MLSLSVGFAIKNRNDPMDHNHAMRQTRAGNITASAKSPAFRGFSMGPEVPGSALTIAISPARYVPHKWTNTCQCFARRKKPLTLFKFPPGFRFKLLGGSLSQ
jgi:hypothetical protein